MELILKDLSPAYLGSQTPYVKRLSKISQEVLFEVFQECHEFYELNLIH